MSIFVDTSALLALVNANDNDHEAVARTWDEIQAAGCALITTNYVLLEAFVLMQNRLGLEAVGDLIQSVAPLLEVEWVSPEEHEAAVATVLAAKRRDLSLVDCTSFATMHRLGVSRAFTLDDHFREQGFERLPEAT